MHDNIAVFQYVIFCIPCPFMHMGAIKKNPESCLFLLFRQAERFGTFEFLDVDIPVSHFTAMSLQLDLFNRENRQAPVPIIFQYNIVGNQFAV